MKQLNMRPLLIPVALIGAMALSGCAREIGSDSYEGAAAGEISRTYAGVVENVRQVEIQEQDRLEGNKTGQLLGGVAGGFAGSAFGSGLGQAAAVAAGAIIGSVIGSVAEQEIKRQPALEYIVRSETGELVTVVQGLEPALSPGQRVFVQEGRLGRSRIIPAV